MLSVLSYTVVPLATLVKAFLPSVVRTGGINLDVALTVEAEKIPILLMLLLFIVMFPPMLRVDRVPKLVKLLLMTFALRVVPVRFDAALTVIVASGKVIVRLAVGLVNADVD